MSEPQAEVVELTWRQASRLAQRTEPGKHAGWLHWVAPGAGEHEAMLQPLLALGESELAGVSVARELSSERRNNDSWKLQSTSGRLRLEILHERGTSTTASAQAFSAVSLNVRRDLVPQEEEAVLEVDVLPHHSSCLTDA
jgi:hypothetical protein